MKYIGKYPNGLGKFGEFGGMFAPEILMPALTELKEAAYKFLKNEEFMNEYEKILRNFSGRPTPLYFASKLSKDIGCKVYLKREDLNHGGAHKINNVIGQALLARKIGKSKLVAETGAGQHGFATAIAGAYFGMDTKIFMGEIDIERQAYNVYRMQLLGAEVIPVKSGSKTLKDAVNEGLRYWIANFHDTHYLMGSVVGPHPYPYIVREFQRIIGKETKRQILELEGRLPNAIISCIGGGSNCIGISYDFIEHDEVQLIGVEAAGKGKETGQHSIALGLGRKGVLHGSMMHLLQDKYGNILETHSISAGLDYPGVGPEHCFLSEIKRLRVGEATDDEALRAFQKLSKLEGIIPALESSHALAYLEKIKNEFDKNDIIIINLSGSGSKDLGIVSKYIKFKIRPGNSNFFI
ncbi:MAG TPA: tryptophan synthase subunit beta [Candidatus Atribacteria bacterium]|nr:tryptophan synthase subunit beta [Candidatus Atribacteria bacterium]